MPSFELLNSELIVQGRAFRIRRDLLKTPDGRTTHYEIVEHTGSAVMLPIDADGNLWFVRQYRHAAGKDLLELPAGTRDGEEPYEVCAAREMREETGMAAGNLERLADFYLAPGYSTELMAVFLATDLKPDPLTADTDEFLQLERVPVAKAFEMALSGQLPDAKTLAALLVGQTRLQRYV